MRRRSLRSTLLAWNTGVVVALLSLFGLGVTVASQIRLRSELDGDLRRQARRALELGPPPERPPPRSMEDLPERFRPLFEPARRLADIRQPRFFDREGRPLRPRHHPPGPGRREEFRGPPNDPIPFPGAGRVPNEGLPPSRIPSVDPDGLQAGVAGQAGIRTVVWNNEPVRVYSAPIVDNGEVVGVVQLARELRDLDNLARSQLWTLALFLPLAAGAAGAAAVALANRALRPIADVTRTASQIGGADLSRRLEVVGDDELAELARTFNGMLGRLEGAFLDIGTANERLGRALDAQRRFTADASHELRTPLTRLRLATEVGRDPESDEAKLREALATAERASGSMTRLVDQLLTLARVDAGQLPVRRERLDLRVAVAEALEGIPAGDRVEATFPDRAVPLQADPDHIRRIVTNLIENALRHSPAPRRVFLRTIDADALVGIEVRDEGDGIPSEHLTKVFERFHRVDPSRTGGGSGLGLAICRDLVHANGGEIHIESPSSAGTRVLVTFPKLG